MGLHLNIVPPVYRHIILAIILLAAVIIRGSQLFLAPKRRPDTPFGAPRDYGLGGGAICPKCHRPFALSLLGLNIGAGLKLTRCPYCQKWSLVRRASLVDLRRAESEELIDDQAGQKIREKSETEKTQELLEESRYTDKM